MLVVTYYYTDVYVGKAREYMEKFSVKKPFTILVMVVAIIILGFVSLSGMTTDLLPKMSLPYLLVITTYPGASPEEAESEITKPMEQQLATLSNIKNVTSVSAANYSMIQLEFSDSVNMEDLTRMMRYNSCAELETILNEAAVRAAFTRKTGIDMEDMVSVVLKQQYGAQEDMPRVSDEVIEKVALHEAGHLVVCEALCPGSVGFASLLPSDENRCGGFIHCCKYISGSQSAIIALGGKAAVEMRYAGQVAEGCSDDIACAVNCIREAAAKEGTLGFSLLNVESDSSSNMSESLNARSEAAVQAELERYYGKARALLAQNEAFLKEITEALVMKKTLLYSDIQAIRGTAVKRNPAVTCEAASRYDAAEIENSPPEDPEEAIRQKILRKLEEAERRRCS